MILEEYVQGLLELMRDNPKARKFEVVYAIDEEGNEFKPLYYGPTIGSFDQENHDFHGPEYIKEVVADGEAKKSDFPINAVCIN